MVDAAWKKLKDKVTAKRRKKRDAGDATHNLLKRKELTVQLLSSKVSGKAQKYARIGPREFMPFTEDELTIENIKDDFQSVLRSLRTVMFMNIINGELDGMRIDVIR